jgi:hypothetical protein
MTVTAMGRVNVAAPGTPVPLATDPTLKVSKIFVQVIPGLTSKAYIGQRGMNKATLAGVIRVLWPNPTGGICDQFYIESTAENDSLPLSEYCVDMDVAGEGVLVSYWTV